MAQDEKQGFVTNAVIGDIYELEAGRLALRRGVSEPVRRLAEALIDDHTTSAHQLTSTFRGMESAPQPPLELDERRADMIDHLRKAPDDAFDARFLEQQYLAHEESVRLFRGFAESGDDPRLRLFAAASLPTLERHLELVRGLRSH
ncbi:MAG: DUF4142 domain-containing protein [Alphaproteobacteria bacterium]|nr:DUF4142 domain-containing protein [Alphaproteobacteria bacterium]